MEVDGDVEALCGLTREAEGWSEFVAWFSAGEVGEPIEIEGDRARVPFRFGPDGDRSETMELVRQGGRWYLSGF